MYLYSLNLYLNYSIEMKKYILPIITTFLVVSCTNKVNKSDLVNLNGDWEISQVETPEGKTLDYGANMTVDFFQIDSVLLDRGIRKKFMPQFDGTRLTNGIDEQFVVVDSVGTIFFKYKTDYATWVEEVVVISPTEFVTKNDNNIIYKYKRYEPIIFDKEE